MPLKTFTEIPSKGIQRGDIFGSWELSASDTAAPLVCPRYNDKSVHIFGTWGGATVSLQASNDPDLATFGDAYDPEGTVISQTSNNKPWVIFPNVFAIKPVISGGDGTTDLKVVIIGRGA